MYLSLAVPEEKVPQKNEEKSEVDIYQLIETFTEEELLLDDERWFCPKCQRKVKSSKKIDLWKMPDLLIVHFKRFMYTTEIKKKLKTFVEFPTH
jgi:ubiquitin C-terminal hydrolase